MERSKRDVRQIQVQDEGRQEGSFQRNVAYRTNRTMLRASILPDTEAPPQPPRQSSSNAVSRTSGRNVETSQSQRSFTETIRYRKSRAVIAQTDLNTRQSLQLRAHIVESNNTTRSKIVHDDAFGNKQQRPESHSNQRPSIMKPVVIGPGETMKNPSILSLSPEKVEVIDYSYGSSKTKTFGGFMDLDLDCNNPVNCVGRVVKKPSKQSDCTNSVLPKNKPRTPLFSSEPIKFGSESPIIQSSIVYEPPIIKITKATIINPTPSETVSEVPQPVSKPKPKSQDPKALHRQRCQDHELSNTSLDAHGVSPRNYFSDTDSDNFMNMRKKKAFRKPTKSYEAESSGNKKKRSLTRIRTVESSEESVDSEFQNSSLNVQIGQGLQSSQKVCHRENQTLPHQISDRRKSIMKDLTLKKTSLKSQKRVTYADQSDKCVNTVHKSPDFEVTPLDDSVNVHDKTHPQVVPSENIQKCVLEKNRYADGELRASPQKESNQPTLINQGEKDIIAITTGFSTKCSSASSAWDTSQLKAIEQSCQQDNKKVRKNKEIQKEPDKQKVIIEGVKKANHLPTGLTTKHPDLSSAMDTSQILAEKESLEDNTKKSPCKPPEARTETVPIKVKTGKPKRSPETADSGVHKSEKILSKQHTTTEAISSTLVTRPLETTVSVKNGGSGRPKKLLPKIKLSFGKRNPSSVNQTVFSKKTVETTLPVPDRMNTQNLQNVIQGVSPKKEVVVKDLSPVITKSIHKECQPIPCMHGSSDERQCCVQRSKLTSTAYLSPDKMSSSNRTETSTCQVQTHAQMIPSAPLEQVCEKQQSNNKVESRNVFKKVAGRPRKRPTKRCVAMPVCAKRQCTINLLKHVFNQQTFYLEEWKTIGKREILFLESLESRQNARNVQEQLGSQSNFYVDKRLLETDDEIIVLSSTDQASSKESNENITFKNTVNDSSSEQTDGFEENVNIGCRILTTAIVHHSQANFDVKQLLDIGASENNICREKSQDFVPEAAAETSGTSEHAMKEACEPLHSQACLTKGKQSKDVPVESSSHSDNDELVLPFEEEENAEVGAKPHETSLDFGSISSSDDLVIDLEEGIKEDDDWRSPVCKTSIETCAEGMFDEEMKSMGTEGSQLVQKELNYSPHLPDESMVAESPTEDNQVCTVGYTDPNEHSVSENNITEVYSQDQQTNNGSRNSNLEISIEELDFSLKTDNDLETKGNSQVHLQSKNLRKSYLSLNSDVPQEERDNILRLNEGDHASAHERSRLENDIVDNADTLLDQNLNKSPMCNVLGNYLHESIADSDCNVQEKTSPYTSMDICVNGAQNHISKRTPYSDKGHMSASLQPFTPIYSYANLVDDQEAEISNSTPELERESMFPSTNESDDLTKSMFTTPECPEDRVRLKLSDELHDVLAQYRTEVESPASEVSSSGSNMTTLPWTSVEIGPETSPCELALEATRLLDSLLEEIPLDYNRTNMTKDVEALVPKPEESADVDLGLKKNGKTWSIPVNINLKFLDLTTIIAKANTNSTYQPHLILFRLSLREKMKIGKLRLRSVREHVWKLQFPKKQAAACVKRGVPFDTTDFGRAISRPSLKLKKKKKDCLSQKTCSVENQPKVAKPTHSKSNNSKNSLRKFELGMCENMPKSKLAQAILKKKSAEEELIVSKKGTSTKKEKKKIPKKVVRKDPNDDHSPKGTNKSPLANAYGTLPGSSYGNKRQSLFGSGSLFFGQSIKFGELPNNHDIEPQAKSVDELTPQYGVKFSPVVEYGSPKKNIQQKVSASRGILKPTSMSMTSTDLNLNLDMQTTPVPSDDNMGDCFEPNWDKDNLEQDEEQDVSAQEHSGPQAIFAKLQSPEQVHVGSKKDFGKMAYTHAPLTPPDNGQKMQLKPNFKFGNVNESRYESGGNVLNKRQEELDAVQVWVDGIGMSTKSGIENKKVGRFEEREDFQENVNCQEQKSTSSNLELLTSDVEGCKFSEDESDKKTDSSCDQAAREDSADGSAIESEEEEDADRSEEEGGNEDSSEEEGGDGDSSEEEGGVEDKVETVEEDEDKDDDASSVFSLCASTGSSFLDSEVEEEVTEQKRGPARAALEPLDKLAEPDVVEKDLGSKCGSNNRRAAKAALETQDNLVEEDMVLSSGSEDIGPANSNHGSFNNVTPVSTSIKHTNKVSDSIKHMVPQHTPSDISRIEVQPRSINLMKSQQTAIGVGQMNPAGGSVNVVQQPTIRPHAQFACPSSSTQAVRPEVILARWIQPPVCRKFISGRCPFTNCKFIHGKPSLEDYQWKAEADLISMNESQACEMYLAIHSLFEKPFSWGVFRKVICYAVKGIEHGKLQQLFLEHFRKQENLCDDLVVRQLSEVLRCPPLLCFHAASLDLMEEIFNIIRSRNICPTARTCLILLQSFLFRENLLDEAVLYLTRRSFMIPTSILEGVLCRGKGLQIFQNLSPENIRGLGSQFIDKYLFQYCISPKLEQKMAEARAPWILSQREMESEPTIDVPPLDVHNEDYKFTAHRIDGCGYSHNWSYLASIYLDQCTKPDHPNIHFLDIYVKILHDKISGNTAKFFLDFVKHLFTQYSNELEHDQLLELDRWTVARIGFKLMLKASETKDMNTAFLILKELVDRGLPCFILEPVDSECLISVALDVCYLLEKQMPYYAYRILRDHYMYRRGARRPSDPGRWKIQLLRLCANLRKQQICPQALEVLGYTSQQFDLSDDACYKEECSLLFETASQCGQLDTAISVFELNHTVLRPQKLLELLEECIVLCLPIQRDIFNKIRPHLECEQEIKFPPCMRILRAYPYSVTKMLIEDFLRNLYYFLCDHMSLEGRAPTNEKLAVSVYGVADYVCHILAAHSLGVRKRQGQHVLIDVESLKHFMRNFDIEFGKKQGLFCTRPAPPRRPRGYRNQKPR